MQIRHKLAVFLAQKRLLDPGRDAKWLSAQSGCERCAISVNGVIDTAQGIVDLWQDDAPAKTLNGTQYEVGRRGVTASHHGSQEYMFLDALTEVLDSQDPNEPMFLFFTPQSVPRVHWHIIDARQHLALSAASARGAARQVQLHDRRRVVLPRPDAVHLSWLQRHVPLPPGAIAQSMMQCATHGRRTCRWSTCWTPRSET